MAEVKSVIELVTQAKQLDEDIIAVVVRTNLSSSSEWDTTDHLLMAREKLAQAINHLLKAL